MSIRPSTQEEKLACTQRIEETHRKVKALKGAGKRVHFIWDADHVLISGRSDDVFTKLAFDVNRYFAYEERLLAEPLEYGPWSSMARACGSELHHDSQDIVTARSTYLNLRLQHFLLQNNIPVRWHLGVGHQEKQGSYEIILKSFAKDPDMYIFMVDDGAKHVDAFNTVATELGMQKRCFGIVGPQIRDYDESVIEREIELVLNPMLETTSVGTVVPRHSRPDEHCPKRIVNDPGRHVVIVPNGRDYLKTMFWRESRNADMEATVELHRESLMEKASEVWPDNPSPSVEDLYHLYDTILGIACP